MKIGILTHPQNINYGGIMQCYALYTYLSLNGHEPIVIKREIDQSFFLKRWIRSILTNLHFPRYYKPNKVDNAKNIRPFVEDNILRTELVVCNRQMKSICGKYNLDAVIVGSDQVWRADYALNYGYNYFLDFVPNHVLKIAYAASFGLDTWMYSNKQTTRIISLLERFNAVSVREMSGKFLCNSYLGVDPIIVLDPTLLLSRENYDLICGPRVIHNKYIFIYMLGDDNRITEYVTMYKQQGYEVLRVSLKDDVEHIPVDKWLSSIKYADKVITDSYHGCIFSLIYNKPFILFENKSGGSGRIVSLLSQIGLDFNAPVIEYNGDYKSVCDSINNLKEKAINFLTQALK